MEFGYTYEVKFFVLHINAHQKTYIMEEEIKQQTDETNWLSISLLLAILI